MHSLHNMLFEMMSNITGGWNGVANTLNSFTFRDSLSKLALDLKYFIKIYANKNGFLIV